MIKLVEDYKQYIDTIPQLIRESNYNSAYFVLLLDLKPATYYRKLKQNSFTTDEIELITYALFPQEDYSKELKESIARGREDIKNGNIIPHEVVMEDLRKEYLSQQLGF